MGKIFIYPVLLLVVVAAGGYFFSSCETGDQSDSFPVTIESFKVDYLTSNSAWTIADFTGDVKKITEMGICYSLTNPPDIGHNKVVFTAEVGLHPYTIEGLQPGQTYYARAFAIHAGRVEYSDVVTFTTTTRISDIEGNNYEVVKIGNQLWMAENLRVEKYRNNDPIEDGTGRRDYSATPSPKYFFHYGDAAANKNIYGNLYTWFAATDTRGLCPAHWTLPDVGDWETLISHLDALAGTFKPDIAGVQEISAIAGGMMRTTGNLEESTGLWRHPNSGATNVTRMSILPSGERDPSGAFDGIGFHAAFWSFTEKDLGRALMFYSHFFNPGIHTNSFPKSSGYAVRCVRNLN